MSQSPGSPGLLVLTGPLAAGKSTVAQRVSQMLTQRRRTVVVVDVDEVAAMVGPPGAAAAGLWPAAHRAHGALVGQWMRSAVDHVVAVGPIFSTEEQAALTHALPPGATGTWVLLDAAVEVTLARARAQPGRGRSREPGFHRDAHRRFRELRPLIPADLVLDCAVLGVDQVAAAVASALGLRPSGP